MRSCVSLISGMSGQPEKVMAYWLDLYYQVRLLYEQPTPPLRLRDVEACVGRMLDERLRGGADPPPAAPTEDSGERIATPACALVRNDGNPPVTARAPRQPPLGKGAEETAGRASPSPTEKAEAQINKPDAAGKPGPDLAGFEPVEVKTAGKKGGAPKGNTAAAQAAAEKRRIRDRLQRMRQNGISQAKILNAAEGNVSQFQLSDILEGRVVPIVVYRILDAALDQIELDQIKAKTPF